MSTPWWSVAAGLLIAAAVAAAWPLRPVRRRLHAPRPFRIATLNATLDDLARRSPRRLLLWIPVAAAVPALLIGGPVAAVLAAVYATLATRAFFRQAARRRAAAERARSLDGLCALAADLRAGLPAAAAAEGGTDHVPDRRLAALTAAVWRLAERTGAPAADLVERIETDARTADRASASAAAQAAGAQATALLLAALPVGGIALGYGIGVDPLAVLLHTALGGACAIAAALLQGAGLLWADRLATGARQ